MQFYKLLFLSIICTCLNCTSEQNKSVKSLQPEEHSLLNPQMLKSWKKSNFSSSGPVSIKDSLIIIGAGNGLTGVTWSDFFPKKNYEISLEVKRVEGNDFFCGLTFPVRGTNCSLIVGGWGGMVVGISNVDWFDASENITTLSKTFQNNQWYFIRLNVTNEKILVWIDNNLIIDLVYLNHQLSIHQLMKPALPFGIATWKTKAYFRNILLKENIDSSKKTNYSTENLK